MADDTQPIPQSRRVLVVVIDGSDEHRRQVQSALTSFYRVAAFDDGDKAVSEMARCPPCVILVDEQAPPCGGARVIGRIRNLPALAGVPIIFTTQRDRVSLGREAGQMGAAAALVKPFRRSTLMKTISGLVNRSIEGKWDKLPETQRDCLRKTVDMFNGISDLIETGQPITYSQVSESCGPLVDVVRDADYQLMLAGVRDHDNYSYVHSLRVATLLSVFGNAIGLGTEDLLVLASGGLMHDVGKMAIAHEVLNKPGKLTPEETLVMRSHVPGTVQYLTGCPSLPKGVIAVAEQHHEKLDGSGYPKGLKGAQLNDLARMGAIVDVFSALTDRRVYKPSMTPEDAFTVMSDDMRPHLDQGLLATFREVLLASGGVNASRPSIEAHPLSSSRSPFGTAPATPV